MSFLHYTFFVMLIKSSVTSTQVYFLFPQEASLEKKLKTKKKKKPVKVKVAGKNKKEACEEEEDEEAEGNEGEQENSGHRDKASSALIPPKKSKLKPKTKLKDETPTVQESLENDEMPLKGCRQILTGYILLLLFEEIKL